MGAGLKEGPRILYAHFLVLSLSVFASVHVFIAFVLRLTYTLRCAQSGTRLSFSPAQDCILCRLWVLHVERNLSDRCSIVGQNK